MSELAKKKCLPCQEGTPPLSEEKASELFSQLEEGWEIIENQKIVKTYKFKDFQRALIFVNDIGKTAEEEGHHPDINLSWGKVKVALMTHKIKGLSEADFVLAAKCDALYTSRTN